MMPGGSDTDLLSQVSAFLYLEARLADESRYQQWLDLWTDDAHYWIPAAQPGAPGEDYDRDRRISFVNDNRSRLTTRIRQLQTGLRWAQSPPSPMRRVVSNIELLPAPNPERAADSPECPECVVGSNFVLYELSVLASNDLRLWAGRCTHRLRWLPPAVPSDQGPADGWRMVSKTVELVNAGQPLPSLAFLL